MAKQRVHELAKELGQPSKVVLQKLQDMGEFVRSASSTIEAPVARRLRSEFPAATGDDAPAKSDGAPKPGGAKGSAPKPGGAKGKGNAPKPGAPNPAQMPEEVDEAPKPIIDDEQ